jgi:UDP-N-acetylmuramate dehydrogenase
LTKAAAALMTAKIACDVSLAPLTSWLVGGPAEFYAEPKTIDDLSLALKWARNENKAVTILSGGTNVLISDEGIKGLVVCLRKMAGTQAEEKDGRLKLTCLAGTSKSDLLKNFLKTKLEPALFLAGLPGDVGGGVVMNAGVGEMFRPREFAEITDWVEILRWDENEGDYRLVNLEAYQLKWSYRHCEGWRPGVIARVGLSWALEPSVDILQRVKAANHTRLTKQPLDMPSCGSVFINPPGHKSGQLIEGSGLKGFTSGGAQVSPKHANFIVNTGKASAKDIHSVIEHVRKTVYARTGVDLTTEVVYLGSW